MSCKSSLIYNVGYNTRFVRLFFIWYILDQYDILNLQFNSLENFLLTISTPEN